jgi:hypothetical protein
MDYDFSDRLQAETVHSRHLDTVAASEQILSHTYTIFAEVDTRHCGAVTASTHCTALVYQCRRF